MKKALGIATSFLMATSLLASPAVQAASNEQVDLSILHKRSQHLMNQNEISIQGYDEYGGFMEEEPNNTFSDANKINVDDYVIGTFVKDDKDYYKLEISGDEKVDFYASIFSASDEETEMKPRVTVYDTEKQKVEADEEWEDDYGSGNGFVLEPGTYYMEATDLANLDNGEEYILNGFVYEEEPIVERISGKDRYYTAAAIAARQQFGDSIDNVVLATGEDFPDALAAAPLAYYYEAPILLTEGKKLSKITEAALTFLQVEHVTIVGGKGAVSTSIEDYLEDKLNIEVDRVAGKDRYETAAAIAKELPPSDTAVVAYGKNFPDALSIAPVAAQYMMPILLTDKDQMPDVTKKALKNVDHTLAIGGTGVIGSKVYNALPGKERIAGKDRYDTGVEIAKYFDFEAQAVTLATGTGFADALAGSVLAANYGEPLLLTPKNKLDPKVRTYLEDNETFYFTIFGGTGAVGEEVEQEIWEMFE
ncbi:cell wall-binding repeat-containing protein [Bacillus sp. Cs-700]|uniref:cell wall-binding repeat-containing protein n=1 Tax=Bacillus sp. Cs-700 TaxID=2589818 RepID=UPI00140D3B74|nr:cell wall-binding repeat-containing protein [Bacillus sp. Cs-700]